MEIREENGLGKKVIFLALNILSLKVLIQYLSGQVQLPVATQERKLGTKHRTQKFDQCLLITSKAKKVNDFPRTDN